MRKTKKGGYRKTDFGELVKSNPALAAKRMREVWIEEGSSSKAAKKLDISRRSFFRCVDRLLAIGFDVRRTSKTANLGIDTVQP